MSALDLIEGYGYADLPHHQPECFDAPIPGRVWFASCEPDCPRVFRGRCLGCGEVACDECGRGDCPDHGKLALFGLLHDAAEVRVSNVCPACRGTGGGQYNDCPTCDGNGVV